MGQTVMALRARLRPVAEGVEETKHSEALDRT